MWNKWLFKDLQELHPVFHFRLRSFASSCFKNHIKRKKGEAAEQENGTNDMNSDSSANEMDEDSG